jgi:hypothetical protein
MAYFAAHNKNDVTMTYADTLLDRRAFSTDNNEYATGLNDENEWDENIMDYNVPLDDYIDSEEDESHLYNETGFDPERVS